jgi:hypothetical protein
MGELIGVLPIGEHALLIVRHQLLPFLLSKDEDFLSDELVGSGDPAATPLARNGKPFLADAWTVSGDAGYICTKARNLIRVTKEHVAPLDAPGACEAVATDDNLNLLVSLSKPREYSGIPKGSGRLLRNRLIRPGLANTGRISPLLLGSWPWRLTHNLLSILNTRLVWICISSGMLLRPYGYRKMESLLGSNSD